MEVEVHGRFYASDGLYPSKKQAEQSAARTALEAIEQTDVKSVSKQSAATHVVDPPPSYSEVIKADPIEHLPSEYSYIEQYISLIVGLFNGRIRKIWATELDGLYKFEITGGYRYCEIIQGHHSKRTIYFMVDPANKTYYQMCYDPQCSGLRSATKTIHFKPEAFANMQETNSQQPHGSSTNNAQLLSKIC